MSTVLVLTFVTILAVIGVSTPARPEPAAQIVIENDRLEPRMFETLTGERVDFLNRKGHPVVPRDVLEARYLPRRVHDRGRASERRHLPADRDGDRAVSGTGEGRKRTC
jgi:hypothetical protein